MIRTFLPVWSLVLILALPGSASAGEIRLAIQNGHVALSARDVTLREVLLEWERVGGTRFVNRDRLPDTPLTIELVDVPEDQALETLLRATAGYLAVRRLESTGGASQFSRIFVMPGAAGPVLPSLTRDDAQPSATRPPAGSGRPPMERRIMPDGRVVAFPGTQGGDILQATDDEQELPAPPGGPPAIPPQAQFPQRQVAPRQLLPEQSSQGQFVPAQPRNQAQIGSVAGSSPLGAVVAGGSGDRTQPVTPKAPTAAKSTPSPGMVIPEPRPAAYVPGGGIAKPPPAPIKPPGI